MKKLIALAALFSAPFAFAAQNHFTFQVNSSGANMYVCGFGLADVRAPIIGPRAIRYSNQELQDMYDKLQEASSKFVSDEKKEMMDQIVKEQQGSSQDMINIGDYIGQYGSFLQGASHPGYDIGHIITPGEPGELVPIEQEQVTGSYATWEEVVYDEWTGEEISRTPRVGGSDTIANFSNERVDLTGTYTTIEKLQINLSSEYYGAAYEILVCYNVPQFLEVNTVDFKVDTGIQFQNMRKDGKNYLEKGKIYSAVASYLQEVHDDENALAVAGNRLDIVNGTAKLTKKLSTSIAQDASAVNRIVTHYLFREMAHARRPHLAHGGQFTLDTVVTPIAK